MAVKKTRDQRNAHLLWVEETSHCPVQDTQPSHVKSILCWQSADSKQSRCRYVGMHVRWVKKIPVVTRHAGSTINSNTTLISHLKKNLKSMHAPRKPPGGTQALEYPKSYKRLI